MLSTHPHPATTRCGTIQTGGERCNHPATYPSLRHQAWVCYQCHIKEHAAFGIQPSTPLCAAPGKDGEQCSRAATYPSLNGNAWVCYPCFIDERAALMWDPLRADAMIAAFTA